MLISMRQSGGWGGLRLGCSVDTDTLPQEERLLLERAMRATDLFGHVARSGFEADVAQFEVEVTDADGVRLRGRFRETDALPEAQALLRVMRPHLRPQSRSGRR